jgi:acetyl CoA:N6-hydroxylysine acetyl transferase
VIELGKSMKLECGLFSLSPVQVPGDTPLVHSWMNDPAVARFWHMAHPMEDIDRYMREQAASARSTSWIGSLEGFPMSYWELYRADLDALAHHYPAQLMDVGVHMLIGPPSHRGRGLGRHLLRAVSDALFAANPETGRVVAEPDTANTSVIRALELSGFQRVADLRLPDKQAALMVRHRTPREAGRAAAV